MITLRITNFDDSSRQFVLLMISIRLKSFIFKQILIIIDLFILF